MGANKQDLESLANEFYSRSWYFIFVRVMDIYLNAENPETKLKCLELLSKLPV